MRKPGPRARWEASAREWPPDEQRLALVVKFLAFEADPFTLMVVASAESGRHHRHAAGRTDRRTIIRIHVMSIPQVPAREAVCSHSPGPAFSHLKCLERRRGSSARAG